MGHPPSTLDVSGLDTGGADVTPGFPWLHPPGPSFTSLEPSCLFASQEHRIRVLLTRSGGLQA